MEEVKKWVTTLFVRKQELIQAVLQLLSTGLFRVGIGKDPTVELDVEGDVSLSGNLAVGGDMAAVGDLEILNGATVVTRLSNANNVGTDPDIWFSGNAVIAAEASLWVNVDSNNDSTNATLIVGKDTGTNSPTQLLRIEESGNVKVGAGTPITTLDIAGESVWIRSGQSGGLGSGAGKGLRLGYVAAQDSGSIFAYDYATGTAKNMTIQGAGGALTIGGALYGVGVYSNTTASAANVRVIDAGGLLARSTSSIRYKTDVTELPDKWGWPFVKRLRPVAFRSTCEADDPNEWHVGLVAEEVAALGGLEQSPYVSFVDGQPEGVQYERLVVPAILTLQQQAQYIKGLEQRIAALEAKVG